MPGSPSRRHWLTLLKLHKELWVLGKVRKGKLGLGSVNRRVELQGTELCGFSALLVMRLSEQRGLLSRSDSCPKL